MKKSIILSFALAALTMGAAAQTTDSIGVNNNQASAASGSQTNAQFPGGQKALTKFLTKNVEYPDAASAYDVEGCVTMRFTVNEDGSISNISAHDCKLDRFNTTKFSQETEVRQKELKEQFAKLFAKEGARVVRKMPKWTPAKVNGKAVKTVVNQPIRFVIPYK